MQLTVRLSAVHVLSPPPSFSNVSPCEVRNFRSSGLLVVEAYHSHWRAFSAHSAIVIAHPRLGATLRQESKCLLRNAYVTGITGLSKAPDFIKSGAPPILFGLSPYRWGCPKGKGPVRSRGLKSECRGPFSEGLPNRTRLIVGVTLE